MVTTKIPLTQGVLLAGGLARRMGGGDKPMRTIGGHTILERVIARLSPQCDGLILNANGDPARFAVFGLQVIADDVPEPVATDQSIPAVCVVLAEEPLTDEQVTERELQCLLISRGADLGIDRWCPVLADVPVGRVHDGPASGHINGLVLSAPCCELERLGDVPVNLLIHLV